MVGRPPGAPLHRAAGEPNSSGPLPAAGDVERPRCHGNERLGSVFRRLLDLRELRRHEILAVAEFHVGHRLPHAWALEGG